MSACPGIEGVKAANGFGREVSLATYDVAVSRIWGFGFWMTDSNPRDSRGPTE